MFKDHRLVYHSTLGSRLIKMKNKKDRPAGASERLSGVSGVAGKRARLWLAPSAAQPRLRASCEGDASLSHRTYQLKCFSKVNSPTNPST